MGRKKELLVFRRGSIIKNILSRIPVEYNICLSVSKPVLQVISGLLHGFPNVRIVVDAITRLGSQYNPIIGIYSLLSSCGVDCMVIWAGDSPLINANVLEVLYGKCLLGFDAVVPIWEYGRIDPVHAAYSRSTLAKLAGLIRNSASLSIHEFVDALDNVFFVDVARFGLAVADVDTPLEYGFMSRVANGRL